MNELLILGYNNPYDFIKNQANIKNYLAMFLTS